MRVVCRFRSRPSARSEYLHGEDFKARFFSLMMRALYFEAVLFVEALACLIWAQGTNAEGGGVICRGLKALLAKEVGSINEIAAYNLDRLSRRSKGPKECRKDYVQKLSQVDRLELSSISIFSGRGMPRQSLSAIKSPTVILAVIL